MSRIYGYQWCGVCGKWITSAGAARTSHYRKHVRLGEMTEGKVYDPDGYAHPKFTVNRGIQYKSWKKKGISSAKVQAA